MNIFEKKKYIRFPFPDGAAVGIGYDLVWRGLVMILCGGDWL